MAKAAFIHCIITKQYNTQQTNKQTAETEQVTQVTQVKAAAVEHVTHSLKHALCTAQSGEVQRVEVGKTRERERNSRNG